MQTFQGWNGLQPRTCWSTLCWPESGCIPIWNCTCLTLSCFCLSNISAQAMLQFWMVWHTVRPGHAWGTIVSPLDTSVGGKIVALRTCWAVVAFKLFEQLEFKQLWFLFNETCFRTSDKERCHAATKTAHEWLVHHRDYSKISQPIYLHTDLFPFGFTDSSIPKISSTVALDIPWWTSSLFQNTRCHTDRKTDTQTHKKDVLSDRQTIRWMDGQTSNLWHGQKS